MRSLFFARNLLLFAGTLFALPGIASACEYVEPPSLRDALITAPSVFVFRLDAAEAQHAMSAGGGVEGAITVVDVLRGKPPTFRHITYSSEACGGVRLDMGHTYLVATNQDGSVLMLAAGERAVVDTTIFPEALDDARAHLSGKPLPKPYPSVEAQNYLSIVPPPPVMR